MGRVAEDHLEAAQEDNQSSSNCKNLHLHFSPPGIEMVSFMACVPPLSLHQFRKHYCCFVLLFSAFLFTEPLQPQLLNNIYVVPSSLAQNAIYLQVLCIKINITELYKIIH